MAERDPFATVADPNAVETIDALGARRRADRDRAIDPEARERLLASLPSSASSTEQAITIGRYRLLDMVGSGGMGMVFGAWDPELERRVALKLVKILSDASRERMLREGQILARLSHPNVVPVFDVGQVGDQIYLVMEYVRGMTLKAFAAKEPGRRAILDAYRQAGAGLAAAHDLGIIHRDFKPANAVRGDDERVRVLDFGIAHTGGATDIAGTPAYMAPEQVDTDATLTAAVDQFAFCVSLREALAANGGVPAWIATILDRGTRAVPAERFATFRDLLSALAHDPAKRWRRIAVAGAIAVAAGTAFVVGQRASDPAVAVVEPCVGGAAEISRVWNPTVEARMLQHLTTLGPRGASEGARLAGELAGDAKDWAGEHRAACLASERKELSPTRYDARLACLSRTRAHFASVVDLVSSVEAKDLDKALFAARMRPDVHGCADPDDQVAPPPAGLAPKIAEVVPKVEQALVLAAAWQVRSVPLAEAAVIEARAIGYAPLLARALLVHGRALEAARNEAVTAAYDEAVKVALRASDDTMAVEAYARWIFARAVTGQPTTEHLAIMELLGTRLGPRGRYARALLANYLGIAYVMKDDLVSAREVLERAAKEAEGAPEIDLAIIGQQLANLEPTIAGSLKRAQATYQRYQDALGPAHAQTIFLRALVGSMTPDLERARTLHDGCGTLEDQQRGHCVYEAAWLADEAGDIAAAIELMGGYPSKETPTGRIAQAYAAMRRSGLTPALRRDLEKLSAKPVTLYARLLATDASLVLALGSRGVAADEAWERANALATRIDVGMYRRRRARIESEAAKRWATSRPREAAALAEHALVWYRETTNQTLVTRLEAIKAGAGSR